MYVLVEELQKHHTSVAIRLRAVRTYNVLHSRGRDQIKSRECVFHDLAMGRIKLVERSGEVKICSSYDATKLLFNQNTVDFVEFRESLCMQQQTPLKSITSNSTFSYGTKSGGDLSSSKMQITTLSETFSKRDVYFLTIQCSSVLIKQI
nr:replication protein A 70 kDa DNA-binding subunit D-like [Ipomoea batatas]